MAKWYPYPRSDDDCNRFTSSWANPNIRPYLPHQVRIRLPFPTLVPRSSTDPVCPGDLTHRPCIMQAQTHGYSHGPHLPTTPKGPAQRLTNPMGSLSTREVIGFAVIHAWDLAMCWYFQTSPLGSSSNGPLSTQAELMQTEPRSAAQPYPSQSPHSRLVSIYFPPKFHIIR